jgi:nucleoside-diphosphate-sugar epimerase
MRVLLVGASSSISKALLPFLSEFCDVITAGRTGCDITIDLKNIESTFQFPLNIDVLIHTAAHFGGNNIDDIIEAEEVNVIGTLKLCNAAVKAKVSHFILISSIFSTLQEDSIFYSIYSLSKKHAEEITKYYCTKNSLSYTILRPSQIYGIEDYFRKHQPFLYSIIDKVQNGEDIYINGSHDPSRNFIFIDDLVMIITKVIQKRIEGTFSCTQLTDVKFSEITNAAIDAFNSRAKLLFLTDKEDIPDNIFDKDFSLYEKIGYYPQITIQEGIARIIHYRKSIK